MISSESYLTAPEHRECYDGLVKSYNLDKDFFSSYDVYPLKRSRDYKDKDECPFSGSDQGLKKRKTSKDAEPTIKELELKVGDTTTPQGQEGNQGNDNDEPRTDSASRRVWFTKLSPFRLLKGTRLNYAELEYDFKECYKALSEKLDWENPKGGDYPFDLSEPLPLITRGNRQSVLVEFFINNDLKYLQGGFGTQRTVNVVAARENVGSKVVRQSRIQCFNCREFGNFAKEYRKPKRVKDFAYHKEKMLMCKQAEQGVPLQAEQYDWLADTDEEVDE
nr:hypothetical protein [Tanacetum cinerariifolium]